MKGVAAHRAGILLAIVAAFGFSFKAILIKLAYPYGVDAITLLVLRMAFAFPIFAWVGFAASRSAPALTRGDWLRLACLGGLGYYGASVLDFIGLHYISAGLERLILFTYPTLTLLFGRVALGRSIRRRQWAAMLLCYVGIALAVAHDIHLAGSLLGVMTGAAFVFASSVCYALYLTGSGNMIDRLGAARFTALAMLASSAATFGHFAAGGAFERLQAPWPVYAYGAAMAIFSTVVPVFAQSAAIRRIGSGEAAQIGMVGPLLTIYFAAILLDEPVSIMQTGGLVLVVVGVALVIWHPASANEKSAGG